MAAVVSGRQTANQKEYGREGRESDGTRPLPRTRGVDPTGYYGTHETDGSHARAREFIASKDTSHWKIHLSANDQLSKHTCRGTRDEGRRRRQSLFSTRTSATCESVDRALRRTSEKTDRFRPSSSHARWSARHEAAGPTTLFSLEWYVNPSNRGRWVCQEVPHEGRVWIHYQGQLQNRPVASASRSLGRILDPRRNLGLDDSGWSNDAAVG